ncbi:hypothetical protein LEP1GSC082_3975 [Leptospira kirschneri str. H2]|nr:hypothetical protein LEP1GSC082_3975 [Leptospira kirschneri str. H2]
MFLFISSKISIFQGRLFSGVKEDVNKALKSKQLKKAVALLE